MKKHILYSFRRCPYAMRARWAIKKCGISLELREINLKNKPSEFTKNSNNKTVPLLILEDGQVIEESLDIVLWSICNSKDNSDVKFFDKSFEEETFKIIKENDLEFKYHLDRFKYSSRFNEKKKLFHFKTANKIIKKWNNKLTLNSDNSYWLIGNHESIADWCLWPFVRQFKIACESQKISNYFETPIKSWLNYFENHKDFNVVMHKYDVWSRSSTIVNFPIS